MNSALERVLRLVGLPDLVTHLVETLSPTDLQTLLLALDSERAKHVTPARLLDQYQSSRFVKPAAVSAVRINHLEGLAFELVRGKFEALDLSPVCPLGSCSSLAPVSQNKVVSNSRNTEVVSDSTNVMALEAAVRRKRLMADGDRNGIVRLCSTHRLTRAQKFDSPGDLAHFRVFACITAGRDQGSRLFERSALAEHIGVYTSFVARLGFASPLVRVTDLSTTADATLDELRSSFPNVQFEPEPERAAAKGYYDGLCYGMYLRDSQGEPVNVLDGGLTDWTQKLLSDRKEGLFISGLGMDRLCQLTLA